MKRMWRVFLLALALILTGNSLLARAPEKSLRPLPRPLGGAEYAPHVPKVPVYYRATIRPTPRPRPVVARVVPAVATTPELRPDRAILIRNAPGVSISPRPFPRPRNMRRLMEQARARQPEITLARVGREVRGPRRGSVCGDRAIRGEAVPRVRGKWAACGIANPVRVTEVDGVRLTTPATIDCTTAKALKRWVHQGAKPVVGRMGGGIRSLRVIASYSCRTRNSKPGAKISEHARGRALDIAAINLNNGTSLTVLTDWQRGRKGRILHKLHRAACGPFGTVLGPDANRYHRDHFHFDTARYRSGSYCR